jgi:cysteine desulfurase
VRLPIYLDYMATTPVDPRVTKKMLGFLEASGHFGNPASTTHSYGWQASEAVEMARAQVATTIGAQAEEIVWTSGATEANNLAIMGAARFYSRKGKHIITAKTEHRAVLDPCRALMKEGFEISYLEPDANGIIHVETLARAVRPDTILVSLMHVNNEIGMLQDIASYAAITRPRGILLHTDAAQSIGKAVVDVSKMDVDLLSMSAHKAYGPKGIGALYVRRQPRVHLEPIIYGGGHEKGLRSGTLPTHLIVAMAEAFQLAQAELEEDSARIKILRDRLWQGINQLEDVHLHGDWQHRVANNLNVGFDYVEGEALLMALQDIAVSTGSACTSASLEPSHVLLAMGLPTLLAHSSLRLSLGRFTTLEEIDYAIEVIQKGVTRLRNLSPLWEEKKRD